MKILYVFVGFLLLAAAVAQQNDGSRATGQIYGVAIGQDGKPAKGLGRTAEPLGVPLGAVLPHVKTNDDGEYRFENLPWWGRYTVYAEDEEAGYSSFSTGPSGKSQVSEVELSPEHPQAEFDVHVSPKAGFLRIHLTSRRTNKNIAGMRVAVMAMENPASPLFTTSCYSNRVVLLPSSKNLLVHVSSDGFREWEESVGRGKPLNLRSGEPLTLDVQLEPEAPRQETE